VFVGPTAYNNCGGAFYKQVDTGFQIVPAPVGAIVNELPISATEITVNGVKYFIFGGAYYRPFYSGSSVVYQIAPNPTTG